jgi:tetratricopeptide (TPR) repeat protein
MIPTAVCPMYFARSIRRALTTLSVCLVVGQPRVAVAQHDGHADNQPAPAAMRLGTVVFPNSGARAAQASFLRGVALLHSFHYEEAASAFQSAERVDTSFAMPVWLEAFTHSHLLWGEDDPTAARKVLARLGPTPEARLARAVTPRERGYGAAIEAFFADTSVPGRARAFADSMRGLTTRNPDDLEAAAFGSLALMMAIGEDTYPAEELAARKTQMVDLAEHVFAVSPNHPGAAHYLIHVSDLDPSYTTRSLPAARAYARIAPDASHAQHMPSHVFLRLGLWDEVASSNERSWAASRREMVREHLSGAELDAHSLSFLEYAYLETGRWRAARALIDSARRVIGNADPTTASHIDARYAISELASLYAAETGRWRDAVLPPVVSSPPQNQRERGFAMRGALARGVIVAERGDTAALGVIAAVFRSRADSMVRAGTPWTRRPIGAQFADFAASELEGLLAQARGDRPRAMERFAHAGDFEDRLPFVAPPPSLFARELLGAEYLRAGQPDSAAAQFERVLANTPNRSVSLLGLARARLAAGDRAGATATYAKLLTNWRRADADLPALAEVRAGAAGRFANNARP